MRPFAISQPAEALLRSAAIEPEAVNDVMDRRAADRRETFLRPGHPYPVLVRRRTGVPLMTIARRRRHLYIVVEWSRPLVRYVEYARDDCRLLLLADLPAAARLASVGGPLDRIVGTPDFLADASCADIRWADPFTEVSLQPFRWGRFGRKELAHLVIR